jgi:hypothetical protein
MINDILLSHFLSKHGSLNSVINTSEDNLEPLTSQVFVIGLNGWMITYDTAGSDTIPHMKEKPEFLMVGNVSRLLYC